jgi:hypothetical protein
MSAEQGAKLCPICRKPAGVAGNRHAPFCTDRCRLIDLGRWLDGSYQVPVSRDDAEADDGPDR